jgi:GxxExxY protein
MNEGKLTAEDAERKFMKKFSASSALSAVPSSEINRLGGVIVDAAIEVHRLLGPGLLESAYEAALAHELHLRGLQVERQKALPVEYKGVKLDCGCRLDLVVQDCIILELKAVEALTPLHEAQILTYLKLSGLRLGYLINFNVNLLKHGLKRMANNL